MEQITSRLSDIFTTGAVIQKGNRITVTHRVSEGYLCGALEDGDLEEYREIVGMSREITWRFFIDNNEAVFDQVFTLEDDAASTGNRLGFLPPQDTEYWKRILDHREEPVPEGQEVFQWSPEFLNGPISDAVFEAEMNRLDAWCREKDPLVRYYLGAETRFQALKAAFPGVLHRCEVTSEEADTHYWLECGIDAALGSKGEFIRFGEKELPRFRTFIGIAEFFSFQIFRAGNFFLDFGIKRASTADM